MGQTTIRKEQIRSGEVVTSDELSSDGTTDYETGVTVVSTTAATKRVVVSGFSLNNRDTPVKAADLAVITGNVAAGTFTVDSVVSDTEFDVVETILDSTGGTVAFRHRVGAKRVGVDPTNVESTSTNLQAVLEEIDDHAFDIGKILTDDVTGNVLVDDVTGNVLTEG